MRQAPAPRVLLASCARLPVSDGDDDALPSALADLGVTASWAVWDDPHAGFDSADLVVLRCPWDYTWRLDEFLSWCESVPALANPVDVIRWNTHKTYLTELRKVGAPVVPTQVVAPGESVDWSSEAGLSGREVVVKPAVAAGSRGAQRFRAGEVAGAEHHLEALHRDGQSALVQPYQAAVDEEGETALVFFGGVYSHAFSKGPMLNRSSRMDGSGLFVAERVGVAEPTPALRNVAEDTLDAACELLGRTRSDLLYARVDLVRSESGAPLLLELELAEPSLGFRHADAAAPLRFASAVRSALARR